MLVTKPAPDFKAQAVMPDNTFKEISLSTKILNSLLRKKQKN